MDVFQLPDVDREAIWSGDVDVLNKYAPDVPDLPSDVIHTVVVSLNPESRSVWEAKRHMTDDEQEVWDEGRIRESERAEPEIPRFKMDPEPRFDKWGYQIS